MVKKKKKSRDRKILNFFGSNYFIAILTILILILTWFIYQHTVPKIELFIFYDPIKDPTYFSLSNLGDKPATNVKINYKIDCQNIGYSSNYINKEIPLLTPANGPEPNYIHYFDNKSKILLDFQYNNQDLCKNGSSNEVELNVSEFYFENSYKEFNLVFCDSCQLNINVFSDKVEESFSYDFINPNRAILKIDQKVYPSSECQGHDACASSNITFINRDYWNENIKNKEILMRLNDDVRPTKVFIMLNDSK